jgi:hypothetical protein
MELNIFCFIFSELRRPVEVIADEMKRLGYSFTFVLWKKIFEKRQDILSKNEIEMKMVKSKKSNPPDIPIYLYYLDQLIDTTSTDSNERSTNSTASPKSTPLNSTTAKAETTTTTKNVK